jgi:hypothetical protein
MVNETVLSKMVKEFGDVVMGTITQDLYGSGLVYLIVFVGGTAALLSFAFSLHKKEAPIKALMFFAAWAACLPVGGRPLAYTVVNGLGTSLAYQLQKTSLKILDGAGGAKAMPPGWVVNALMRAGSSEITDPQIQDDVLFVMENCVPNVPNKDGEALTVADLFGGTIQRTGGGGETFQERFDPRHLKARKVERGGSTVNCYDVLTSTRARLRSHLLAKDLTKMPEKNYLGPTSGEVADPAAVRTTWAEPTTRESQVLRQSALNVATAAAIQKTAMGQLGLLDVNSAHDEAVWRATAAGVQGHFEGRSREGQGGWLTRIAYDLMATPTAVARALNIDGAVTSAMALHEMNEKLLDLPYYVAFVQSVLKILAPLAVLTLLFGTFKFFFTWSFTWILMLVMPVVVTLSRGISNAILFHTNKLTDIGRILETEPGFMALGINFDAASKIVEDTSRMMNVILNVELGIWVGLLFLIPGGAWLAGNVANRVTATVAGGLVGTAMRAGTPGAIDAIGRGTARTVTAAPKVAVAAGTKTVQAARQGASYAARSVTFAYSPTQVPPKPAGPKPPTTNKASQGSSGKGTSP